MLEKREHWGSSIGFIFAAAGSAIGLGNIWKFPYIAGQNGGGAFVLIYLACIVVVGMPIMLCEMTLGRATQKNPVGAFKALSPNTSHLANLIGVSIIFSGLAMLCFKQFGWSAVLCAVGLLVMFYGWITVGILCIVTPFAILSYYCVVGGWTIGYIYKSFAQEINVGSVAEAGGIFGAFIGNTGLMIGLFLIFLLFSSLIVWGGVRNGIERWSKILMPLLFILLLVIMLRGLSLPGARRGVAFFLKPDFTKLSAEAILIALGHAFFTLSLGMGAMITYSSYISREQNIFLSSLAVVFLDTLVAIFAGLAIFSTVFAMGFNPDAGPSLVFKVLPAVFSSIPLGWLWAGLFFLLLSVAALTSSVSLLEVAVSYFIDERKWSRHKAVLICTLGIVVTGLLSAVSITDWHRIEWLHDWLVKAFNVQSGNFFETIDNLSSNWFLPLGGLGISLFVGWIWGTRKAVKEIRYGSSNFADVHLIALLAGLKDDPSHNDERYHVLTLASLWGIFIRFVAPVAITIAFLWMNIK
ncbi:MAG: sodium-dependent transporter [Victivallaceae bacterium]|nr:sodium-dependent transporter [Victivallaceae bacterium]